MAQHEQPDPRQPWGRPGERPGAPRAADQLADQGLRHRPAPSVTARAVSGWVDQQIEQAQRQGAFDNLQGAGRPLPDVDTSTDPDWWVRSLVEREKLDLSAAMPGPMQLRREKAGFPASLLDLPDEATVRAHLEDFNERVLADRRRPYAGAGSPPVVGRVDVDEVVASWREARARRDDVPPEAPDRTSGQGQLGPAADLSDRAASVRRRWWHGIFGSARP
ncbi:DUF1992 domain-containing protein [Ornithinimicrobium tianjinense]|uniref:DnaJ homologue subfamily C member 28 conserved domain-containing protein n=1 Tax=Ornithinimicrobium tianjinense TaxID=1195761 RepID=A0A917F2C9_9MICO|nr:DUF1992 domain-containing protein [Ornithinimicrobium tianjinense]GGF46134.1 hypothetical protein GCM10011366_12330 [Ornithinimicrobium tianjinense]